MKSFWNEKIGFRLIVYQLKMFYVYSKKMFCWQTFVIYFYMHEYILRIKVHIAHYHLGRSPCNCKRL